MPEFNIEAITDKLLAIAPSFIKAIVVLIIGLWVINKLVAILRKYMTKSNMDEDLIPFLSSLASTILKVLLVFSVAEMVGVKTTSFIAMLAAAGFAIGMALQGSLGNFASGVLILLFKPYKTGDLIEVAGEKGWVESIQIFNTSLLTATNQQVIIPNAQATSDKIINHSTHGHIRVDLYFSMPYAEDFKKVNDAIMANVEKIDGILMEPAPSVGIETFESHNIQIGVFLYSTPEQYWDVYYSGHQVIKETLGESGIKMAYSEGIELGKIGKK